MEVIQDLKDRPVCSSLLAFSRHTLTYLRFHTILRNSTPSQISVARHTHIDYFYSVHPAFVTITTSTSQYTAAIAVLQSQES